METEKIGNTEFNIEFVKGKTLTDLRVDFPHVKDWILKEVSQKYGKRKSTKKEAV
jgi:hypothetical protein